MRQQIASALTAVIQIGRLSDGKRKLVSLVRDHRHGRRRHHAAGESSSFKQTGIDPNGNVLGTFHATGVRPKFLDRLTAFGVKLPDDMFNPNRVYD